MFSYFLFMYCLTHVCLFYFVNVLRCCTGTCTSTGTGSVPGIGTGTIACMRIYVGVFADMRTAGSVYKLFIYVA